MPEYRVFRKKYMPMSPRIGDHFRVGPWTGTAILIIPGFVVMKRRRWKIECNI